MVYRIFQAYLDDENSITIELEKSFDAYSIHFTLEDKRSSSPLTIKKLRIKNIRLSTPFQSMTRLI